MLTLCQTLSNHAKMFVFQFAFGFEGLETISSEYLRTFSATFGRLRKSSEVDVTFSEIAVMTRQFKSHTFDSEKVGRYSKVPFIVRVRV